MAIDDQGNIHAVRVAPTSPTTDVFYSKYNGTSWSSWVNLSNSGWAKSSAEEPIDISVDNLGRVHVVWMDFKDGDHNSADIYYRKWNGSSWESIINLSNTPGYWSEGPRVSVDDLNNVHVAWFDSSPSTMLQFLYRRYNGSSWEATEAISDEGVRWGDITADHNNTIHLVYGYMNEVLYTRNDGSGWTYDQVIYTDGSGTSYLPRIVSDDSSRLHLVWYNVGMRRVFYGRFNGSTWESKVDLSYHTVDGNPESPDITVDAFNYPHILFHEYMSGFYETYHIYFDGSDWSDWLRIDNDAVVGSIPSIGITNENQIYALFQGSGSTPGVYFNMAVCLDGDSDGYDICDPDFPGDTDGYVIDCDDTISSVYPSAPEVCNGRDDDCDEDVDEPGAGGCTTYYRDGDSDGYGQDGDIMCLCTASAPYTATEGDDCDDGDPSIYPDAPEYCNGSDDDCDGSTDEEDAVGCTDYLRDADEDGYGVTGDDRCYCSPTGDYTATEGGDCDDTIGSVYPGAEEICNGDDDDCDGTEDEPGATGCVEYFYDGDGDGFGQTGVSQCLCAPTGSYLALNDGDCDDTIPTVYPGAPEYCNERDDDCDEVVDEPDAVDCTVYYRDVDGDGFGQDEDSQCLCSESGLYRAQEGGDCDDANSSIYPGATEICNGEDDDCDEDTDEEGAVGCVIYYLDVDGDGYGVDGDTKCLCNPEGYYTASVGGDCEDGDGTINPGMEETCNGDDDDCDGLTDPEDSVGCAEYYYDADADGYGVDEDSRCLCEVEGFYRALSGGDCDDTKVGVYPGAIEVCNGIDDDCDDLTDEEGAAGCSIYYRDGDGDGYGATEDHKCLCETIGFYTAAVGGDCDDSEFTVNPDAEEECNGVDDDCDGSPGSGEVDLDGDEYVECTPWVGEDPSIEGGGDCDESDPLVNPGFPEVPTMGYCEDGKDNDCDGLVDDDDPDCPSDDCTLELDGFYAAGFLSLYFTIGTPEPATWITYLILTYPSVQVIQLWGVPLSVLDPPVEYPIVFPFPSISWIGIWSGLFTGEGIQAEVFEWIDT